MTRSAFSKLSAPAKIAIGFVAFAAALLFALAAGAQQKINPNTQINWPAGCAVYNVSTNTCPPVGGINFRGAWSSSTTYAVSDAVYDSGSTYVSLQAGNLNHNPLTSPTYWTLLVSGTGATGPNLSFQFNSGGASTGTAAFTTDATMQALYLNTTNPSLVNGGGTSVVLNGTYNGSTQQFPVHINNTMNSSQASWNYGNAAMVQSGWGGAKYEAGNSAFFTRGINNHFTYFSQGYGIGDYAGIYGYGWSDGGSSDASGEGVTGITLHTGQNSSFLTGTVGGGATTGTQSLPVTGTTRVPSDGAYMLDLSSAHVTSGSVAGPNSQIGSTGIFEQPVTGTFTASTAYGILACVNSVSRSGTLTSGSTVVAIASTTGIFAGSTVTGTGIPGGTVVQSVASNGLSFQMSNAATANGAQSLSFALAGTPESLPQGGVPQSTATVGLTCTATSILGTNAGGFVAGVASLAAGLPEQVNITSVGTISAGAQTVVFTFRNPHANVDRGITMMLWQGGESGKFQSYDYQASVYSRFRSTYNVFGAVDSTHLAVGCELGGTLIPCTNPYGGGPTAITALVQSGTTVTAVGGQAAVFNLQATAVVAGCSASSLNGTVTDVLVTSIGLQWTAAGSGSATCPTATISLPQLLTFHLYPGAEVTGPQSGSAIPLEPNIVDWTPGHSIENPLHSTYQGTGDWIQQQLYNSNNLGFPAGLYRTYAGEGISGGYAPALFDNFNPCSMYAGCGGDFQIPDSVFHLRFQWGSFARMDNFPLNNIFVQLGCPNVAIGGCGNTRQQILYLVQGGTSTLAASSWVILNGNLTVTFTNSLPNGQVLTPTGGQQITLSGYTEPYLNAVFTSTSATSTTVTMPISQSNASATESASLSINGEFFEGDSLGWDPNTRAAVFPNIRTGGLSVNDLSAPKILLGTPFIAGHADFSRDGVTASASLALCNLFGSNHYLGMTDGSSTGCNNFETTNAPNGVLGVGTLNVQSSAIVPDLTVGLSGALDITATVTGGGSTSRFYTLIPVVNGQWGFENPDAFLSVNTAATLDGSHFVTLTCRATLQYGYPAGTTYEAISQNTSSGAWTDVGVCPVGSTLVDNGAATSIPTVPEVGANQTAYMGFGAITPGGALQFIADRYHKSIYNAQISNPSGHIISFDGSTQGDGLASLIAASANFLQPGALTTTGTTSDPVTIAGMTASGHCGISPTNATAATNFSGTYISAYTTNQITVTHTALSGMTYHFVCTPY